MIKFTLNDKELEVPDGTTVLQAARANGVTIPVLNFMNVETDAARRGEESWAMLRAMAPR